MLLLIAFPISNSAKSTQTDSTKLSKLNGQIETLRAADNHSDLALSYIQKSKLEREIYEDTTEVFKSIRNALASANKTNNVNLEFYCLYTLRKAQYRANISFQKTTALDTVLRSMLKQEDIKDTLKYKAHQLWGILCIKHNYYVLALNEFLTAQNIAINLRDNFKIVKNQIYLIQIYDILRDDQSFNDTRKRIEYLLPKTDLRLNIRYNLVLRSFESRFSQAESEHYLKEAIKLNKSLRISDFVFSKELAIYFIDNNQADSALARINHLELIYLQSKGSKYMHAPIHIEELYARYYYQKNNFKKAEFHFQNSLDYCDSLASPSLKRRLLLLVLEKTKDLDNYEMAFNALKSLRLLEDSTMNRSQIMEYQKLKTQLYNEQVSKKISKLEYDRKISELNLRDKNKDILWLSLATLVLAIIILFVFFRYNQKRRRSSELLALNNLKDFIFSVISHDLRSPLYNFNTLLNMADKKYLKEEEYSSYLKTIQSELQGITGVTESLLRWAKSNQGLLKVNLSQVSLMDILIDVKDIFKPELVERNIHIISNFLYDFEIKTDKDLFTFILRNIIQNAIKFSENDSQIEINAKKENNIISVEVVDYGVGMDEQQLENFNKRISDPSNDLSGVKSTGLGLIIAKDFAKRLNIEPIVKSELDKGTSICLTFDQSSLEKS